MLGICTLITIDGSNLRGEWRSSMFKKYAMRCFYLMCLVLVLGSSHVYAQTDLALNKVATASTNSQPAANAVDGNAGTRWESAMATDPSWISVDLGNQRVIKAHWI